MKISAVSIGIGSVENVQNEMQHDKPRIVVVAASIH